MKYEYLFKEFEPNDKPDTINAWLEDRGQEEWEAVSVSPMLHLVGGGLIGAIHLQPTPRLGHAFLMKRPART